MYMLYTINMYLYYDCVIPMFFFPVSDVVIEVAFSSLTTIITLTDDCVVLCKMPVEIIFFYIYNTVEPPLLSSPYASVPSSSVRHVKHPDIYSVSFAVISVKNMCLLRRSAVFWSF